MSRPRQRPLRRGRPAGQARVPHHLEGNPRRERDPVQPARNRRHRRHRRGKNDRQQHFHHRQAERRGPGHAVPVAQANQQHLGAAGAEAVAGQSGRDAQPEDALGRGGGHDFRRLRTNHPIAVSLICIKCFFFQNSDDKYNKSRRDYIISILVVARL
uniref:(northern house mosquito) hypothetical protein n=1 Tax=Culex pipiens TaxID=7175 RepID=A0A8D8CVV5_CULPI